MIHGLHTILSVVWRSGTIPFDWKRELIVPTRRDKSCRQNWNNYHGITLVSVTGKAVAHLFGWDFAPSCGSIRNLNGLRGRSSRIRSTNDRIIELGEGVGLCFVRYCGIFYVSMGFLTGGLALILGLNVWGSVEMASPASFLGTQEGERVTLGLHLFSILAFTGYWGELLVKVVAELLLVIQGFVDLVIADDILSAVAGSPGHGSRVTARGGKTLGR